MITAGTTITENITAQERSTEEQVMIMAAEVTGLATENVIEMIRIYKREADGFPFIYHELTTI